MYQNIWFLKTPTPTFPMMHLFLSIQSPRQLAGALAEDGCSLEQIVATVTEVLKGIGEFCFHFHFLSSSSSVETALRTIRVVSQVRSGWVCLRAAFPAACPRLTCRQEPWSWDWVRRGPDNVPQITGRIKVGSFQFVLMADCPRGRQVQEK